MEVANEFDDGLSRRRAIYRPYPGSDPDLPAIDWASLHPLRGLRLAAGGRGIDLTSSPREIKIEVGAIVVATGFDHYEPPKASTASASRPGS